MILSKEESTIQDWLDFKMLDNWHRFKTKPLKFELENNDLVEINTLENNNMLIH